MELFCDRIEGDFLVCIDGEGKTVNIPLSDLPEGVGEGWRISVSEEDGVTSYALREPDPESLREKRKRFSELFRKKY